MIINMNPLFRGETPDSVPLAVYNNICGALQAMDYDARYDSVTDGLLLDRPDKRDTGWGLFVWVMYNEPGIEIIVKHDGCGMDDDMMRLRTRHRLNHHRMIAETIIRMIAGLDTAIGTHDD